MRCQPVPRDEASNSELGRKIDNESACPGLVATIPKTFKAFNNNWVDKQGVKKRSVKVVSLLFHSLPTFFSSPLGPNFWVLASPTLSKQGIDLYEVAVAYTEIDLAEANSSAQAAHAPHKVLTDFTGVSLWGHDHTGTLFKLLLQENG